MLGSDYLKIYIHASIDMNADELDQLIQRIREDNSHFPYEWLVDVFRTEDILDKYGDISSIKNLKEITDSLNALWSDYVTERMGTVLDQVIKNVHSITAFQDVDITIVPDIASAEVYVSDSGNDTYLLSILVYYSDYPYSNDGISKMADDISAEILRSLE